MKKLREGTITQLLKQLDQAVVSSNNFESIFNKPDGTIISISFRDDPQYYFKVLYPKSEKNEAAQWKTLESPGNFFTSEESFDHPDFSRVYSRIAPWVGRLVEELTISGNQNNGWINDLRVNLEAVADSLPEPETPFSEPEIEEWSDKFNNLIQRLEKLEKENEIQRGFVAQLKQKLDKLKAEGTKLPKRTWLKAAGHKILDVFEHGAKVGIKALAEGAVKALLDQSK